MGYFLNIHMCVITPYDVIIKHYLASGEKKITLNEKVAKNSVER